VATTNPPPKPQSSGSLKYALIGLGLLGGAVALWMFALQQKAPPPAPPPPPNGPARVNPMAQPDLQLEPEPPDAGQPAEAPAARKVIIRRIPSEWDCTGDLPNALSVVNEQRAQIRSCYERRLKVNNVLQGAMRLRIRIGANGKVAATMVGGSLHDDAVFECVKNLAHTWTFPVPTGGACAVVEVPFQFSPKP
jgi:hypothetical protein